MNLIQPLKPSFYVLIEDQIEQMIYDILYQPLIEIIEKFNPQAIKLDNASDQVLRTALRTGRIQYTDGTFSGQFNASIASSLRGIGASFDRRLGVYRLSQKLCPVWVRSEASIYQTVAKTANEEIRKHLGYISASLDQAFAKREVKADSTIKAVASDFAPIARKIEIHPELSSESQARLAKEYAKDIKEYAEDFTNEQISELSRMVQKNADQGYRFDQLAKIIKSRFGVAQNKAKFLARQTSSMYLAKYREVRFGEAGVRRYIWRTSHDIRVRHDHELLNGRIFFYSDPPIVNRETGARGNPGQDYGCRCNDQPVLDPVFKEATNV